VERLQKILASYGVTSRRKAEDLILAGRVMVNNQCITLGTKADPERDRICVDGTPINFKFNLKSDDLAVDSGLMDFERNRQSNFKPQLEYLLLHKPKGFICSRNDPQGRRTIQELLPMRYHHLYSIGRLDYDSSGALLMTNDGDFANRLMHPSHHVNKVYEVLVQGCPSDRTLQKWRSGIDLDGKLTLPAQVVLAETWIDKERSSKLQITINEGRNRQIRRVAKILGHPVIALHRVAIESINLDNLAPKAYRHLRSAELESIGKAES
jgi:16S rRNA pseudouridine516 synthase